MTTPAEPDSPVLKTPEWLEALENKRKRRHKLAHEIGAGAPCLVCKEGCKGLNLHFWRKLCIECKCRKEDHEVLEDDDYAQFEILFGAKKAKRTTLKFNAQTKSFDWIPPNVSPDLVVDYLKSLPESKLPISNSEGARYRKQQLEKQVPLHDVDPTACHDLSVKETQEFNKYLDNLKNNVIGQGIIKKFNTADMLKENYVCDSLSNMIASSREYGNLKPQGVELRGHLTAKGVPTHLSKSETVPGMGVNNVNAARQCTQPFRTPEKPGSVPSGNSYETAEERRGPGQFAKGPKPFGPGHFAQGTGFGAESEPMGPGLRSAPGYLKTPGSFIRQKSPLQDRRNNNDNRVFHRDSNCNDFDSGASLLPQRTSAMTGDVSSDNRSVPCDSFLDTLGKFQQLNMSSNAVPFVPVQESTQLISAPQHCGSDRHQPHPPPLGTTTATGDGHDDDEAFPMPPVTCQQCLAIINPDEVVVQTERAGHLALWHAKCFVCDTCQELLVDLMYFFHGGKVYCGRHYAQIVNIPRCFACDELIFVNEYTRAEGESYHVRHFCCFHCDEPLAGKQYILKDNQPVCLDCYQEKFGKKCQTCLLPIAANDQRVSWKTLDFHVSPDCFRCTNCKLSLLGLRFVAKNDKVFCKKECVQQFFES